MRMFGRLLWFALGTFAGYNLAVRVQQAARAADRLRPVNMRDDIVRGAKTAASQARQVIRDLSSDNLAS
ncbi:MAG TPA: hypothetical protein VHC63_15410 [Acidimicrobiales bacterium]|nr:hypothetical protein [Acidimicrobiales bacterium]